MKEFKKGDKVRFISTTGSGIVTAVNKGIVTVMIEDGFEIPVEASDLVVIENTGSSRNPFMRKNEFKNIEQPAPAKKNTAESKNEPAIIEAAPENATDKNESQQPVVAPDKGLYLAFVPENQELLISGDVEVFLINYSGWQVATHVFVSDARKGFTSLATGLLGKGDAHSLGVYSHTELKDWHRMRLQTLCFDTSGQQLFSAEMVDMELKTTKFIKEDMYTSNPFFDERSYIVYVQDLTNPPLITGKNTEDAPKPQPQKTFLIDRFMVDNTLAEVDLHIEKLRSDYKTMRKDDIMKIQLVFFRQCLDSFIEKGLKRVVFIHGVGAGLLKKELHDILNLYPDLAYEDANILKYGIGATEVRLKQ